MYSREKRQVIDRVRFLVRLETWNAEHEWRDKWRDTSSIVT